MRSIKTCGYYTKLLERSMKINSLYVLAMSRMNFRVNLHSSASGNYRVWIHSEIRT